jgi:gluconate 2-dehydrogenase gamma chain
VADQSRRRFLAATGAAAAAVWLADLEALRAAGRHAAVAESFLVLSPADAADIEAACAQIIPADETPGAREARVVYFIDKALDGFAKDQRASFAKGARLLRDRAAAVKHGARSFAELPGDLQIAVLTAMEKKKEPFFEDLRGATIAGMFAHPDHGGNFEKAGWTLIGFEDRYVWTAPFGWYDREA